MFRVVRCTVAFRLSVVACLLRCRRHGCMLSAACCLLHVVCCTLSAARCLLHVVSCMLSVACRLLHVVSCMLSAARLAISTDSPPRRTTHPRYASLSALFHGRSASSMRASCSPHGRGTHREPMGEPPTISVYGHSCMPVPVALEAASLYEPVRAGHAATLEECKLSA
jgi:hypothetical protein